LKLRVRDEQHELVPGEPLLLTPERPWASTSEPPPG